MICRHGGSWPCDACHKEDATSDRVKAKEGTWAYCVFVWRGDGQYPIGNAVNGKRYKIKSAAQKRADKLAGHASIEGRRECGGFVVRFVPLPKAIDSVQAPAKLGPALEGTVKWFNDSKGYGFITVDGQDLFAHYTGIYTDGFKTLTEGQIVDVIVVQGPKGPQCGEIYPRKI